MNIIFINQCCVDNCHKKRMAKSELCREHKEKLENGEILKAFYGKRIKKPRRQP